MRKENLILHKHNNTYRTVIKNRHGRLIYLSLKSDDNKYSITEYFYADRIRNGTYYAVPQKLITHNGNYSDLLAVIAKELDRKYYGIEIINSLSNLSTEEFIHRKLAQYRRGYKFLIFAAEGKVINGMPSVLKTRFKNRIHRSIYLELHYYSNGMGVIADCFYYDRAYKSRKKVIPEMLTSVFFEYSREAVINLVNNELNTAFTDILCISDNSIDIENTTPICGHI